MKFLGEFIQHFVSRFRNDIFLEDVSSGTIASGGYLGLDSNNKIVKASTVGSGVDLTSEVTGVLPVSNGGTGASTLASDSVLTGNGTSAVQAETHLTWSASTETLSVEGESSSKPIVKIQNNNTDATPGELKFRKLSNVADGDHLGKISFVGFAPSGSPTDVEFATILGEVNEADDGDEEGKLTLSVASHDGESQPGVTIVSGNAEDEVDVTIANGATSLTTIAGTLTIGSTAFVNNSGVIQVATQGTIDHDSLANFVAAEHYRWDNDISGTATIHANNITDLHGAGVDGSANQLLTDDGDGTVTSETDLTFSSGALTMQSSATQIFTLKRTSTGSDNDNIATIRFTGNDDADNALRYAAIQAKIIDASDGAEEGQLNLAVASHDGEEVTGLSLTSGDAEDEVDVSIASGTSSVTTVAGTLTMGSTAFVNNSGVIQVATQGTIDHDSLANFVANEHIDWTGSSAGTIHSTNIPTLNQDTTGNAATATALTSGDKTIEGDLRIGGSGDTSNNWISIDAQNGNDTTGGGITFYETGTYSVSAPQYGAKIVYNEDDDEFAIGTMHNNTFMRQIHMDRGSSTVNMQNIHLERDTSDGPFFLMTKTDTSIADGDSLCRIIARSADFSTSTNISQIQWFATEDHDSNSCGTKINFTVTPNGNSQSETVAMTIGQDSSLTVNGTIELGHESDTTISRTAAGVVKIEGDLIVTTKTTTLTSAGDDEPIATMIGRRTLTTAEMNDLHNTPIEIVPAPGANIVALPTGGMVRVDRASTNSGSGTMDFHYEGLEPVSFGTDSLVHIRRFHFNITTDGVYNLSGAIPASTMCADSLTEDVNKAIEVSLSAAATTDCFTSVDIYLTYQLIKIA
jgi:hypothetical protein